MKADVMSGAGTVTWKDYLELCKPKVVLLMVLTAVVGMCLASPHMVPWRALIFGNLGIGLAACSAAALNHMADRHIDRVMRRTCKRPMVQGKIDQKQTITFALVLCLLSMAMLVMFVNPLTAVLSFASLIAYAFIYTFYLKHATPLNIVIGGIAGAAPPLLGWVAVTGHVSPESLLLVLIIFVWTPPHFWALAIHRFEDYKKAGVPMMPNTHGIPFTKSQVHIYSWMLCAVTLLPFAVGMSGYVYLLAVLALNVRFMQWVYRLMKSDEPKVALTLFKYSIVYLMLLFVAILVDHYVLGMLH